MQTLNIILSKVQSSYRGSHLAHIMSITQFLFYQTLKKQYKFRTANENSTYTLTSEIPCNNLIQAKYFYNKEMYV